MATYTCLLSILLCFLLGIERYQAQEIQVFLAETERRQGDTAWLIHLSSVRRLERIDRWDVQEPVYPPQASDQMNVRAFPVAVSLRPSAPVASSSSSSSSQPASFFSSFSAAESAESFPEFSHTVYPVFRVPDWGAMRSAAEWDRPFSQIPKSEFVPLPPYNLSTLQISLRSLTNPLRSESIPALTAKLTYSTRYYGAYDLDAGEFSGLHPGIDFKLAFGTPVGAIAGGRVKTVTKSSTGLGLSVIVEHHLASGERIFSIYGHLDTTWVKEGQDVGPGQTIGTIGMSGQTTAPHLHLQIDRDDGSEPHRPFWTASIPSTAEASRHTLHPIHFMQQYAAGAEG